MVDSIQAIYSAITSFAPSDVAIFSDYDGTLTPIVSRPEDASLSESSRNIIEAVNRKYRFIVVTGRSKPQLLSLFSITGLYTATSQGFEISGPDYEYKAISDEELTCLRAAYERLQGLVASEPELSGVQLENKEYNIAIHYRHASDQTEARVLRFLEDIVNAEPKLALHHGKKVFELRPNVPWHKGKAVAHIMLRLGVRVPVYLGDDITDEDAFAELETVPGSVTVLISEVDRETKAKYRLHTVAEVIELLSRLALV